jgi:polyhydroxybutyrate depolymerase
MPILAFHGTADPILPYSGGGLNATRIAELYAWHGVIPKGMPKPLGIDESMRLWAKHNGCNPKPVEVRVAFDVQKRTWTGCKATTVLYIVDGGGHGWPGKPVPAMEKQFGHDTSSIDATSLIFKFFFG